MTAAPTTSLPRMSAKSFLFSSAVGEDSTATIGRVVRNSGLVRSTIGGLHHVSSSTQKAVESEIGAVTESLLEVDLGDALVDGWRGYSALADAARRTLAAPGSEEVLPLVRHTVTWTSRPRVDVLLDGITLNSFEFEITFMFELTAVSAVIKAGNLAALRGGSCVVTGAFSLEGAKIAERKRRVDLGLMLPLVRPVSLLGKARSGRGAPSQRAVAMADDAVPEATTAE